MSRIRKEPGSTKRKILLFVFILICLFGLIFASAKGKYQFPLSERLVVTITAPVNSFTNIIGVHIRKAMEGVWEIVTVYNQNKMLKSEIEQLRGLEVKLNEATAENERLRVLLAYKQNTKQFDLVTASVIARDSGSWSNVIIINRGTNDGITKDMAVVTAQGLVGNVAEAFSSTARVQLILDPRSSVGAIVQRPESRVAGIVEGNLSNQMLGKMINIPRDADVVEGDQVITSGYGGIYPKGIAIGTVQRIENDAGGLLKYAILQPSVDFKRLEEVSVITASRELPPQPLNPVPNISAPGGIK